MGCMKAESIHGWHMGAHGSQQKGVKGNKTDSCNAIVVAGKGDVKGKDTVLKLMYLSSTSTKEAGRISSEASSPPRGVDT